MTNEERIKKLEDQVRELLAWKTERTRQQIVFPLDEASKQVITKDVPVFTGNIKDNGTDVGAMCAVNGRILAFLVEEPSAF